MDIATTVTLGLLFALIPTAIVGILASAVLAGRPAARQTTAAGARLEVVRP